MVEVEEYDDPRLVALYDLLNPYADDTAFYIDLASDERASSIVDIGCGTGLLACELARRGHQLTGVDPSAAMLDVARRRPGAGRVRWVEGDASRLGDARADLAIMTGHVAQVFLDDADWHETLAVTRAALRPGGLLAFESRNPVVRPWAAWTPESSLRRVDDPVQEPVEVWHSLKDAAAGRVSFETHYRFLPSEEVLVSQGELRFRTQTELVESLATSGFVVEHVFGTWDRQPVGPRSSELIFVARSE